MDPNLSSCSASSLCEGPLTLAPSSVTEVSFDPDPVLLCPSEFPRDLLASSNRLACGGNVGGGGNAISGGGRGDGTGRGRSCCTEEARGLPTEGVCCI